MKTTFKIKGLDCANCAAQLENCLSKVEDVQNVSINFLLEKLTLEYDENNKEEIIKNIKKIIKKEEPDVTIEEI